MREKHQLVASHTWPQKPRCMPLTRMEPEILRADSLTTEKIGQGLVLFPKGATEAREPEGARTCNFLSNSLLPSENKSSKAFLWWSP